MKNKKYALGKTYKDYFEMKLSFYTRYVSAEIFYGDPDEEEENLAVSILRSIKKVTISSLKKLIVWSW